MREYQPYFYDDAGLSSYQPAYGEFLRVPNPAWCLAVACYMVFDGPVTRVLLAAFSAGSTQARCL